MTYYYFTADWCGPCKSIKPHIAGSKKSLITVNVDTQRDLAAKYGVRSIPTIIGVENDRVVENYNGSDSILRFLNA